MEQVHDTHAPGIAARVVGNNANLFVLQLSKVASSQHRQASPHLWCRRGGHQQPGRLGSHLSAQALHIPLARGMHPIRQKDLEGIVDRVDPDTGAGEAGMAEAE